MKLNELILRLEVIRKEQGNMSVAGVERLMFSPAEAFAEIFPFVKEIAAGSQVNERAAGN